MNIVKLNSKLTQNIYLYYIDVFIEHLYFLIQYNIYISQYWHKTHTHTYMYVCMYVCMYV
jgi:hypothetical protein